MLSNRASKVSETKGYAWPWRLKTNDSHENNQQQVLAVEGTAQSDSSHPHASTTCRLAHRPRKKYARLLVVPSI